MRKLYLVRHGRPDFPGGEHCCLGLTDMPLGAQGRLQACALGAALADKGIGRVYSSTLSRAFQTAELLGMGYTTLPGLEEMSAGDWDGLSFSEIRDRWPELFARRGGVYAPIPNSEDPVHGQRRFKAAAQRAMEESEGDVVIVAHATVIQSLICAAQSMSLADCFSKPQRQPYCSWYELDWDGEFHYLGGPYRPVKPLTRELAERLLEASGAPERVRRHCRAVAGRAEDICTELLRAGLETDAELIYCAALLHDVARAQPEHPRVAAGWLDELGYHECAELVRQHHDPDRLRIDGAGILYIADKCVIEDETVSLARRFERSLERCDSDEARAAHRRRAGTALDLQEMINTYCGKEVIA